MAVRIEPTTPADLDAVARLLCIAFNAPPDARFVDRELLHWKYFERASGLAVPRSYVLRQGAEIMAHCGLAPLTVRIPRHNPQRSIDALETVSGFCSMDWAGDRRLPGAGVILMKKLTALTDISIIVAGSDDTRALAPKIGFPLRQTFDLFARVIRPLRQARSRPKTDRWRDGVRLVRNSIWSFTPSGRIDSEWRATPASQFTGLPEGVLDGALAPDRTADYLNYWLRCPAARISGFEIRRRGVFVGYFLLSRVGGQSRVADLRLDAGSAADWEMAYRLAVRTAARDRTACEVVSIGSTATTCTALKACGFRRRGAAPLFVYDRRGVLREAPPLLWSMIDDDMAYVHDPQNPYST
jgi:hypothetical protein